MTWASEGETKCVQIVSMVDLERNRNILGDFNANNLRQHMYTL